MGFNPKGEPLLLSRKYIHPIILYLVLVAGCTIAPNPELLPDQRSTVTLTSTTIPVPTLALPASMPETTLVQEPRSTTAFTYQQPDGNRLAIGYGGMPAEPLDIQLSGKPLWVIGVPVPGGSLWVAALESGQVQAFQIEDSEVIEIELNLTTLPPGMPPVMRALGNQVELLTPTPDASPSTHPIWLQESTQAYIDTQGQLRIAGQEETYTLNGCALPDARILSDGMGRLLFLSAPTEEYPHGVLGDSLEATTITIVDTHVDPYEIREIHIDPGDVIEGIAPIWVDLDGDREREIIVTQSNAVTGARIVVYHEDGGLFASGEPIGQGFR